MKLHRYLALSAVGALLELVSTPGRAAETFPSRPITMIVPTPPGGGTDINSRLLASIAEKELGQKILVVNKPGAGGAIGVNAMLQAKPDGYTIAGVWNSPMTITPHMFKVSYNPDSYTPILLTDISPITFCVMKSFPANDGKAFIAELKAHPNKYTYGTDGVSGMAGLGGDLVFGALGVQQRAIPFGGAGETLEAFLGHHVDIYGGSIPPIEPFVKNGSVKCLLLTTAQRNKLQPDALSLDELGIPQDQAALWHAIITPAGTPADRVKILEHAFQNAARSEKYQSFAAHEGEDPVAWGSAKSDEFIRAESKAFGGVITKLGLARKDAQN